MKRFEFWAGMVCWVLILFSIGAFAWGIGTRPQLLGDKATEQQRLEMREKLKSHGVDSCEMVNGDCYFYRNGKRIKI